MGADGNKKKFMEKVVSVVIEGSIHRRGLTLGPDLGPSHIRCFDVKRREYTYSDATNYNNLLPWKVTLVGTHTVTRQEIDEDLISPTINTQYSYQYETTKNVLGLSTFIM